AGRTRAAACGSGRPPGATRWRAPPPPRRAARRGSPVPGTARTRWPRRGPRGTRTPAATRAGAVGPAVARSHRDRSRQGLRGRGLGHDALVGGDQAVADLDHPVAARGDVRLVGDDDDRLALAV